MANIEMPKNCRECKAYDWGKCPFIYNSKACGIRRKERKEVSNG